MESKKCCFIGHRNTKVTNELKQDIIMFVNDLIINENVNFFLFGSRSTFNSLCHSIVLDLKAKYPNIKILAYDCKNESSFLEKDKQKWIDILKGKQKYVQFLYVDDVINFNTKNKSGKASYIARNKTMIDDSDYCLFYYNEKYIPPHKKLHKQSFGCYKSNSGTYIAYKYAVKTKKIIKNFFKS